MLFFFNELPIGTTFQRVSIGSAHLDVDGIDCEKDTDTTAVAHGGCRVPVRQRAMVWVSSTEAVRQIIRPTLAAEMHNVD